MKSADPRQGKISMSRLSRVADCPGSVEAEKGLPEKAGPDAASGTRCHSAMETGNAGGLSDEEAKSVIIARDLEAQLVDEWTTWEGVDVAEEIREARLWGFDNQISGQADCVRVHGGQALLIDYKFGHGETTEAAGNLQLRGLACLLQENRPAVDDIRVAIIQPWVSPQISVCDYDSAALAKARKEVSRILEAAKKEGAPKRPTARACRYCKAAPTCEAYQSTAAALVPIAPGKVIDPRAMPKLLELAALAEKALKARVEMIREQAKTMLDKNPDAIEGWELREGRTTRSVPDAGAAFEALAAGGMIDAKGMLKATKVSLPTLEKQVAQYSELKAAEAKREVATFLGDLIETKQSAPSVARRK